MLFSMRCMGNGERTGAFKARLKCTADGEWPVLVTPEPVADAKAVDSWAEGLEAEWAAKIPDVKLRAEKGFGL